MLNSYTDIDPSQYNFREKVEDMIGKINNQICCFKYFFAHLAGDNVLKGGWQS